MRRAGALLFLLLGGAMGPAAADEPLAPRKRVRPEAWVEEPRFHAGAPERIVITAARVDVVARPAAGAQAVGMARRGESFDVIRASRDDQWLLIEVGAGEVGWIPTGAARAVAPRGRPQPREPEPPPAPAAAQLPVDVPILQDPPAKGRRRRRSEAPPVEPPLAPPVGEAAPPEPATAAASSPHGPFAGLRLGAALIGQRFTSNAAAPLANYEAAAWGFAVDVDLGYRYLIAGRVYLGLDGSYRFAGATGYKVTTSGGSFVLGLQQHDAAAAATVGVRFAVAGGLTLSLLIGGRMILELIDQQAKAPLPSGRYLAFAPGLRLDVDRLVGGLGARLEAQLFAPGQLTQTTGLGDGGSDGLLGGSAQGLVRYLFGRGVGLEAGVRWSYVAVHLKGPAERSPGVERADRTNTAITVGGGLSWVY